MVGHVLLMETLVLKDCDACKNLQIVEALSTSGDAGE